MKMKKYLFHIITCWVLTIPLLAQDSLELSPAPIVQLSHIEIQDQFVDFKQLADPEYQNQFTFGKVLANSFDSIVPYYNYPLNLEVPYSLNTLSFHFIAIDWKAPHKLKYSYRLEGAEEEWSSPSNTAFAKFEDLDHGPYELIVKASAEGTQWSEPFSYSFRINPPWYQSRIAYIFYFVLIIAGGYWAYQISENQKQRRAHIQEILKENKILTLGNSHILNLSSKEDSFIKLINQTLETHLSDENFGIAELCKILNISRAQLHRKLKKLTGLSTSHYIRSLRLHFAKELLDKSELNISEVAFNVGFSSATYFSKAFKAEFGFAPREMR